MQRNALETTVGALRAIPEAERQLYVSAWLAGCPELPAAARVRVLPGICELLDIPAGEHLAAPIAEYAESE